MQQQGSVNFACLAHHDTPLAALATQAEDLFATDPSSCIAKLRTLGELLAKRAAARVGLLPSADEKQQALIHRLMDVFSTTQRSILHDLRRAGNAAAYENRGTERAILAKAFRGELVPQEPSDEPAGAMVARLAADCEVAAPASRAKSKATRRGAG